MQSHDHTMLSLQTGDTLCGRYRLERVLGQGGMGAVWLATDTQLDRQVAIKVLPAVLCRDKRAVARLKDEAKRNLDLTHPNIVRLYNFEQDPARGDAAFLVMQYVEGQTLNDLLAEHPKGLPLDRLKPWFEQVADAIDFAHAKGILHRDIKPANIMIESKTGAAYLMDFGIAAEARDTMTRVTGAQDSSGTLPYMSPQQLMGKNDKSNDVYSFAATLYEALSGHPPFHTGDIAYQIRHAEPEPIKGVSEAVHEALAAGLCKEAVKRPSLCASILLCLNDVPTLPLASENIALEQALASLKLKADQGDSEAMFTVSALYERCSHIDQSMAWLRKAADHGHVNAMSVLVARLLGNEQSYPEALRWARRAAQLGDVDNMVTVAHSFCKGWFGSRVDKLEAARWYRNASEHNHTDAMNSLAIMLTTGDGVEKSPSEAAMLFRKASELGDATAMVKYGRILKSGCGVEKDTAKATQLFRRASELGNADAMYMCFFSFWDGDGVPKDQTEALRWLRKAAELGHDDAMQLLKKFG
jgi:serine/threonine protein kinase